MDFKFTEEHEMLRDMVKKFVDQDITDREISVRIEVELSKPFGFATFETKAALRNIRIRELTEKELAAAKLPPATLETE